MKKKRKTKVRVAVNGIGRNGRLALGQLLKSDDYEVAAINDLTNIKMAAQLLRYDLCTQGKYSYVKDIDVIDADTLVIDSRKIRYISKMIISNLPWKELGIDAVIETTSLFETEPKVIVDMHFQAGAKKVIILNSRKGTLVYYNQQMKKKEFRLRYADACFLPDFSERKNFRNKMLFERP